MSVVGPTGQAQTTSYTDAILADRPVLYWRLDEQAGPLAVDIVGQHQGTYTAYNAPGVTYGVPGGVATDSGTAVRSGRQPEGTGGIVSDQIDLSATNKLTIAATINIDGWYDSNSDSLFSFGRNADNNYIYILTSVMDPDLGAERIRVISRAGAFGSGNVTDVFNFPRPRTRGWHSFHWVVDRAQTGSARMRQYIDGQETPVQDLSQLGDQSVPFSTSDFVAMGDRVYGSLNSRIHQSIHQVALYDYALSPAQIATQYMVGSGLQPTPTLVPTAVPTPRPAVTPTHRRYSPCPPGTRPLGNSGWCR